MELKLNNLLNYNPWFTSFMKLFQDFKLLVWTRCIMHPVYLWRGPAFRPTGPGVGGGGGRGLLQTDPTRFFARYFTGLSLPPPPKTSVTDQLHKEQAMTGRIFQALLTQTDTIVAFIYKINLPLFIFILAKILSWSNVIIFLYHLLGLIIPFPPKENYMIRFSKVKIGYHVHKKKN